MAYNRDTNRRFIPFGLKLQLMFTRFSSLFGFLLMVISVPLLYVMYIGANPQSIGSNPQYVNGIITDIDATNSKVNRKRIFGYEYKYTTLNLNEFEGKSYSSKRRLVMGDTVNVIHSIKKPHVSVIDGMDSGLIPTWTLLPFMPVAMVGIGLFLFGIWRSFIDLKVLEVGVMAQATLTSHKATATEILGKKVYKLAFSFEASDGKSYQAYCRTRNPEFFNIDSTSGLLFDPSNPNRNMLLNTLPPKFIEALKLLKQ